MIVQTDQLGLSQFGVPVVAPPKRVVVTPAREGDRAQEDRRQQHNQDAQKDSRPVFKTLLTESTLAGLNATASKPVKSQDPIDAISVASFVREEKRPETGPASISGEETNGLFSYLAETRRNAEAVQQEPAQGAAPLQQEFIVASARYAEQAVAAANVFAGRGETLELQA